MTDFYKRIIVTLYFNIKTHNLQKNYIETFNAELHTEIV